MRPEIFIAYTLLDKHLLSRISVGCRLGQSDISPEEKQVKEVGLFDKAIHVFLWSSVHLPAHEAGFSDCICYC
jgi:hypothetical protein